MGNEQQLMLVAVAVAVVALVVLAYGVVSQFLREPEPAGPPSLTEAAAALRPPKGPGERIDRAFARVVRGSLLGVSPQWVAELMLLVGAVAAAVVYFATGQPELTVATAPAAMLLVGFVFVLLRGRERNALQDQLPDGLFQVSRSLRAGQSIPQAFRTAAEYSPAPLSGLFAGAAGRMDLGQSVELALAAPADDVALADYDAVVALVGLSGRAGGQLPTLLDRLAASIRDRNQFRGYYRAVTALSTLTAAFVGLAAPAAAVGYLVVAPELFRNFFATPLGLMLFGVAVLLELAGVLWLGWLVGRQRDAY